MKPNKKARRVPLETRLSQLGACDEWIAWTARRSKCVAESHAQLATLAQCADIVRRHYPEPPITEDVDAAHRAANEER